MSKRAHPQISQARRRKPSHLAAAGCIALAVAVAGCGGGNGAVGDAAPDGGTDGAGPDGGGGDAGSPRFLERLDSSADFLRLAGEGWGVKYLAPVAGRQAPAPFRDGCVFQNTAMFPLHLAFLRSFPEFAALDWDSYLALTTKAASRVFWAGELQLIPGAEHPRTHRKGVVALFVYSDLSERLGPDQLAEVVGQLAACAPYTRELLVLVGTDPRQAAVFAEHAPALRERGIEVGDLAVLRPGAGAEGYSLGESYGFVRVVPRGLRPQEYGPRDILVVDGAVEEIGLVAGLLTAQPQNVHSHLNLRLREKKIPNARLPDIYDDQVVTLLDGRLAHLTVTENEARLAPAERAEAEAYWARQHPPAPPLRADLEQTELRPFDRLTARDAPAYGSKAANLGELHHILPPPNRAPGFGVPFSVYRDWMAATGLLAQVIAFLDDPRTATEAAVRRAGLASLRRAVEGTAVPTELIARLAETARLAFGAGYASEPIRFRSSSNVEDGELLSGAGLYDSARACFADDADGDDLGPSRCLSADERASMQAELTRRQAEKAAHPDRVWLDEIIDDLASDLSKERTAARALKRVYASLWNERAFEERAYWGMDHRQAYMAVAVNPSFVLEKLDSVAVTNLTAPGGGPLFRVVSQRDGQPVVRPPDPTLVAETVTFRRADGAGPVDLQTVVFSSLSPGQPLWSAAQLEQLAGLLFRVQDHFASAVYPQITGLSLDLEIKLTADDRIVIKQARPYAAP
jgi:hypothetical protein